jgi:hypothetical protein
MENRNIWVYDVETLFKTFTHTAYNIDTKDIVQFVIHESRNDLSSFIEHLKSSKGQIGFNNLNFDGQIIQYILENYNKWQDKSGSEIAHIIYKYAQKTIEKMNSGGWGDYPEWKMSIPQLDLFKIFHYDNKNKMTSLKWLEFSMDFENIEEMPIHHNSEVSADQIEGILAYNLNDVMATYEFYKIAIGETNHPLYKGIDKIQLRKNIIKEFGIKCINYNDVKIGDEINKIKYCHYSGADKKKLPKPIKEIKEFKFKDCFPEYMEFKTVEFNNFINCFANITVRLKKETDKSKQEFKFTFNGTTYVIARGGIHSEDKPRYVKPSENEILRDADIGSQYPNAIRKRELFPVHLGREWLTGYTSLIKDRIEAKKKLKQTGEAKYQAIQEAYKLSLNGCYGKLGEEHNWQYSPFSVMCVTIGNQIEILMLIESLELSGIHVISANTDGIVCLFDKNKNDLYYQICKEWEIKVGNNELGQLEYADYSLMVQTSVNDYLAVKVGETIPKCKGDFVSDMELHKNKSKRIIPLALQNYFIKNIPIDDTIRDHDKIFDFCLGTKSIGSNRLIHLEPIKGTEISLQKINRYYVSNNGWHLIKRLKPLEKKKFAKQIDIFGNVNDGTRESEIEAGWLSTIYNKHVDKPISEYNINYNYYIEGAQKIIDKVEGKL